MVHCQLLIKQNGANYYTVNHVTGEKKIKQNHWVCQSLATLISQKEI